VEEEEEEAKLDMVGALSFIQTNLQHSIAVSVVISRTVSVKGIEMALTQESYCEGCIRGLNISGHTLFSASRTGRLSACMLTRNETARMLPGFSCRDIVAFLIEYNKEGAERRLVVCSAYLHYDSEDPPL
jgi:hypothetical protein